MTDVPTEPANGLRSAERFSEQQFVAMDSPVLSALTPAQQYTPDSFVSPPEATKPVAGQSTAVTTVGWVWWTAAGLAVLLAGVQWYQFVAESWLQNALQGAAATGLTLCGGGLLLRSLLKGWLQRRRAKQLDVLRAEAKQLQSSLQYGQAQSWLERAKALLTDEPAATTFNADPLLSDAEQLALFERLVLQSLDQRAQQLVRQAAGQTCLAVAVSPLALADLALVSWRSITLVNQIGEIYGVRLTLWQRAVLVKAFLQALFWAGSTELAIDLAGDALGAELSSKLSARAGQGVLAGLLVARLGYYAIGQFRPIRYSTPDSGSKLLITDLVQQLLKSRKTD